MFYDPIFYKDLNTDDPFAMLMQQEGHIYRQVKRRKTIRFVLNNKVYFAKLFFGVSAWEIIKNILKGQWPVIDAAHEYKALTTLAQLKIGTPRVVAYASRGRNPLTRQSFVVMEAVEPAISLEDYLHDWEKRPLIMRRALIYKVADIARVMHENGIQHRDFYICHFLLSQDAQGNAPLFPENIHLTLIDLHRARFKHPLPMSWRIKDLSALYFSVLPAPLTSRDYLRFLRVYTQQPLHKVLHNSLWQRVANKALRLYKKTYSILPLTIEKPHKNTQESLYVSQQSFYKRLIIRKDILSPALMTLLGDPDSIFTRPEVTIIKNNKLCTLAHIHVDGRDIMVKRYRWREGWCGFTRLVRPTRAARCWHFANLLLKNHILTAQPFALIEKRWGFIRRDSYYISEYCHGTSLRDCIKKLSIHNPTEALMLQKLQEDWRELYQRLTALKLSHGDMNLQNILVTKNGLTLIDLDTMRQHFFSHRLSRRCARDTQRFLREWKEFTE